jgi:hypothetical protein
MSWTDSITLSLRRENNIKKRERAKDQKIKRKKNAIIIVKKAISRLTAI